MPGPRAHPLVGPRPEFIRTSTYPGGGCREQCLAFGRQAPGATCTGALGASLGGWCWGASYLAFCRFQGRLPPSRGLHACASVAVVALRSAALPLSPFGVTWALLPHPLVRTCLLVPAAVHDVHSVHRRCLWGMTVTRKGLDPLPVLRCTPSWGRHKLRASKGPPTLRELEAG